VIGPVVVQIESGRIPADAIGAVRFARPTLGVQDASPIFALTFALE
jgi:hypothetical protein